MPPDSAPRQRSPEVATLYLIETMMWIRIRQGEFAHLQCGFKERREELAPALALGRLLVD
jgi:hypothetical protein